MFLDRQLILRCKH